MERKGSISHGTHLAEDLIPAFSTALQHCIAEADDVPHTRDEREAIGRALEVLEERCKERGYFNHWRCADDLAWLFDTLDEFSPEGYYFGAHEGDGADFGWWPCDA